MNAWGCRTASYRAELYFVQRLQNAFFLQRFHLPQKFQFSINRKRNTNLILRAFSTAVRISLHITKGIVKLEYIHTAGVEIIFRCAVKEVVDSRPGHASPLHKKSQPARNAASADDLTAARIPIPFTLANCRASIKNRIRINPAASSRIAIGPQRLIGLKFNRI